MKNQAKISSIILLIVFFALKSTYPNTSVDSLIATVDSIKNDSLKVIRLNGIVFRYTRIDYQIASEVAKYTIDYAKTHGGSYLLSLSYMNMGETKRKSNPVIAIVYFDSALILARKMNNDRAMASIYNNIGNTYRGLGKSNLAIKYFIESLSYRRDSIRRMLTLSNIAVLYYEQKKSDKALSLFKEAFSYFNREEDKRNLLNNFISQAKVYAQMKDYEKVKEYGEKALPLAKKEKDILMEVEAMGMVGEADYYLGNIENGITLIKLALSRAKKNNYEIQQINILVKLSSISYDKNDYKTSLQYSNVAYRIVNKIGSQNAISEILKIQYSCYEKLGNYQKAFEALLEKQTIQDSTFAQETRNRIEEFQIQYETQKNEQQIGLLEKGNQIKLAEIEQKAQQRNWLIVLFLVILIVSFIIYYYYKKTKVAKDKIEVLQREIHHRVKNNLVINRRMVEVAEEKVKDEESKFALQQLSNRMASMINTHQQLYQKQDVSNVDFRKYMDDINKNISSSLNIEPPHINQDFRDNVEIDFVRAVPLGLIVNELLTNSYKHAGNETMPPKITMDVVKKDANIRIRISDNGKGFPPNFDLIKVNTYGLKLVYGLTQQLNGTVNFSNSNGAVVEIVVPL